MKNNTAHRLGESAHRFKLARVLPPARKEVARKIHMLAPRAFAGIMHFMSAQFSSEMTRRQALKTMGAGAMVAGVAAVAGRALAQATPKAAPPDQFVAEKPGV
ncbi:MAG TPA: hypothetical protein VFJ90_02460, partial [Candidatus Didemnitutus sp.]|nr:hypothetical protein [Candidatus Didemnitutus sp.]